MHKRRSLPNLPQDAVSSKSMIAFDSQRPYPRLRDFGYDNLEMNTNTPATADAALSTSLHPLRGITAEEVQPIVQALRQALQLELFGFDVICGKDQVLYVVDVNYFPSYKEVPNFAALLARYLTDRALERRVAAAAAASGSAPHGNTSEDMTPQETTTTSTVATSATEQHTG